MGRVSATVGFLLILLALGCSVAQADAVPIESVMFFASDGGGFDVRATADGVAFLWSFAIAIPPGAQLFSGTLSSPTLSTGSFPIDASSSIFNAKPPDLFGGFSGGTIDASAVGGSINYAITGSYDGNVPVSAFSSPGSFFSLSFSLPQSLSGLSCPSGFANCFEVKANGPLPIVGSVTTTPIPEPGTLLLLGSGLLGIASVRRRFLR